MPAKKPKPKGDGWKECNSCSGTGKVPEVVWRNMPKPSEQPIDCPFCKGHGWKK